MNMRIFLIGLCLFGLVAAPMVAFTQTQDEKKLEAAEKKAAEEAALETLNQKIAEKRNKIKQLEESIDRVKKDIDKKRLEATSLKNQMGILDNRITQVELDIDLTGEKLQTLELEIEALTISIEEKERVIERQKSIIAELMRALQQEDGKTPIEILAAYDNFSEFYNKLQYLESVETDLAANTRSLKGAKEDLEDRQDQTEARKESYEQLNDTLEERKVKLDEQIYAKQNLLVETQSSELVYKTLLGNLKKQYQDIENEITSIEQEVRRRLEEQKRIDGAFEPEFSGQLLWPAQSRLITAYFHDPEYPFRHVFEHSGLDIRAGQGTPIRAAGSGYVARAKRCTTSSCYSYIMIIHSGGISTVYGHLSSVSVGEDQFITRGDVIGYSGGTPKTVGAGPFVTGAHLHFEVRKNGIPVNPLPYVGL
jgi:murein DD-endopeptidase MepM/ murein hydrolase activator NlpD